MGGLDSEIEDDNRQPAAGERQLRRGQRAEVFHRLGLRTDASMRYEKTLDPEMCPTAIARFVKLLLDIDRRRRSSPGSPMCTARSTPRSL